jgi:hypothetical protein
MYSLPKVCRRWRSGPRDYEQSHGLSHTLGDGLRGSSSTTSEPTTMIRLKWEASIPSRRVPVSVATSPAYHIERGRQG